MHASVQGKKRREAVETCGITLGLGDNKELLLTNLEMCFPSRISIDINISAPIRNSNPKYEKKNTKENRNHQSRSNKILTKELSV